MGQAKSVFPGWGEAGSEEGRELGPGEPMVSTWEREAHGEEAGSVLARLRPPRVQQKPPECPSLVTKLKPTPWGKDLRH